MIRPPLHVAILGALGLVPFLWAAFFVRFGTSPDVFVSGGMPLFSDTDPRLWLLGYGAVILAFMSGALWGFAARAGGRAGVGAGAVAGAGPLAYALSTLPALWAFFNWGPLPNQLWHLAVGFLALLILNRGFQRHGLAPPWWMSLRVPLTAVVALCLWIGATA